jgi:CubicO group peptidase (beta-lactamase class C family)
VAAASEAQNGAPHFESVRLFIKKQIVENQVPSIAVAVARDGQILWEEAFGWADRENRIAATEHTMYSLASISKPFTATGLMVLKERGRIDLDRSINGYLGDAKLKARVGNVDEATVRRVANHSAGLPLHYQFFYEDEPHRVPSMDETIIRYGNLVSPPGEKYEYSNLGYGILGYVLARASERSYAEFMRNDVFLPLGLTHTSVNIGPGLEKFQAIRYGPDGLPIPFYDFDHPAASAIYSSAHDLVRFGMFHLKARLPDQKAIISDASIDEMQRTSVISGPDQGYGIGWAISKRRSGVQGVSHSGGMGGVATLLYLIPSHKIAIVALTNTRSAAVFQAAEQIAAILLEEPAPTSQPNRPPGDPPVTKPGAEMVGTWKGIVRTYVRDIPFTLQIKEDGGTQARLERQLWALVNMTNFQNGVLTGQMAGDIGTEDANRYPYVLRMSLKLRGDVLGGPISAVSTPGKRARNALTYWAELKKE